MNLSWKGGFAWLSVCGGFELQDCQCHSNPQNVKLSGPYKNIKIRSFTQYYSVNIKIIFIKLTKQEV